LWRGEQVAAASNDLGSKRGLRPPAPVRDGARWKDVAAARSGLIDHLTPEFAAAAAELVASGTVYFFQVRSVGGAVADVADEATAYSHRSANFSVVAFGASPSRLDAAWEVLATHFRGLYLSFETDQHPMRLEEAWPPATLARLRALKKQYDPANVFRDNFNIDPLGD
jgi:hypothetical protein